MSLQDPLAIVGTSIADKYDVERVVGEGGFAVVYRATHRVWRRPVAIKVFRALADLSAERREQLVSSFIQEGNLLTDLSERSAAIVQARDVGTLTTRDGRDLPFLVLEWLEGSPLDALLESEKRAGLAPRSVEEAAALLQPIVEALALAHKKGIAHRDVKPANVFVLGDSRGSGEFAVKLLDFGIAKVVQDVQRASSSFAETQGTISSFTPAYGAPEQFSRAVGATGPWTDVFALALIFTELVTQTEPLRGDDLTQLGFCSMDPRTRPTPRSRGAVVTDAVEAVMKRALAVAPTERFASAGEMWSALASALASGSAAPLALPPSEGAGLDGSGSRPGVRTGDGLVRTQATVAGPMAATVPRRAPSTRPSRTGPMGLFAGALVAVLLAAVMVAGGVYVFALRGREGTLAASSASSTIGTVPAPASEAPVGTVAPTAPPSCPEGMVLVPGGKFFMGSDEKDDQDDERPAHQVTLSPFCVDRTEVTVAAYKACSDRGECKRAPRENEWPDITARERAVYDPLCTILEFPEKANHPINCVDWELAVAFCESRSARLPTEAEWEFATRGSDGRRYPWGDQSPVEGPPRLNACGKECLAWGRKNGEDVSAMYTADDGFATTAPAGSFPAGRSPFGLDDVVGNVWEWTADWYAAYGAAPQTDPRGPAQGEARVIRGGAWNGGNTAWVRPSYRFRSPPGLRSHGIGFRCVRDASAVDR